MRRLAALEWILLVVTALALGLAIQFAVSNLANLRQAGNWTMDFQRGLFRPVAAARDDVAIVEIDRKSLAGLRYRDPIDSEFLADLVTSIARQKPRLIAVDLVPGETEPEKDGRLSAAIKSAGPPVVLGWMPGTPLPRAFVDARWPAGDISPEMDEDGIWRRMSKGAVASDGMVHVGFPGAVLDGLGDPVEALYGREIDFLRPADPAAGLFHTYPADPQSFQDDSFTGRVVIIGTNLDGRDHIRTPLVPVLGERGGTLSNVEVQAQSIAQLLDRRMRNMLGFWSTLGLSMLAVFVAFLLESADRPRRIRWAGSGIALVAAWLVAGFSVRFFAVDIPLLQPLLAFMAGFTLASLYAARSYRDARSVVMDRLEGIVGADLTQRILGNPKAVSVRGAVCDTVVLSCEIAHLDPLADTLPPQELVATVARLQQRLSTLALGYDGTITRHVPSGLTVLFGAPLAVAKAGDKALRCALTMAEAAAAIEKEKQAGIVGAALGLRIAMHAGPVIVGDFCGGDPKPLYDAVGRTMAVAHLMLDLCPVLGVSLLASYDAAGRVPGTTFRPIGTFELPDWQGTVEVFTPLRAGEAKGPIVAAYLMGMECLRQGDEKAARDAFARTLEVDPTDGPARFHLLRVEAGNGGLRLPWPLAAQG